MFIVKILLKIFQLIIIGYILMIVYYAYKDGERYKYTDFSCKNKSFISTKPVTLSRTEWQTNIIEFNPDKDSDYKTIQKVYPTGSRFTIDSIYSEYDAEGGTFYKYLIEDENGIKSFVHFNDINPKKCNFNLEYNISYQEMKKFHPHKNKVKVTESDVRALFRASKEYK